MAIVGAMAATPPREAKAATTKATHTALTPTALLRVKSCLLSVATTMPIAKTKRTRAIAGAPVASPQREAKVATTTATHTALMPTVLLRVKLCLHSAVMPMA